MTRHARSLRLVLLATVVLPLFNGCAVYRELQPAVRFDPMSAGEYIAMQRGDILTTGRLSAATVQTLRVAGLDACCSQPSLGCIDAAAQQTTLSDEQRLSALSELWLQAAMQTPSDAAHAEARMQAWMESARHAYAYLFFTRRDPSERAFEDRQTQARDWYNHAVQQASTLLFDVLDEQGRIHAAQDVPRNDQPIAYAGWNLHLDLRDIRFPEGTRLPHELLPARSLAFTGLRNTWCRDGFGAELVASVEPAVRLPDKAGRPAPSLDGDGAAARGWSEMPSPGVTVLFRFQGDDLDGVLGTRTVLVSAHDPYLQDSIALQGQRVPLAANFTAGYGLWLARSGFNRHSLRTLFGRGEGIERPHLYLLQPWDPNRRIVLLLHGLASSPEAWVDVANELQADHDVREHFQIWLAYYPTNMPIVLNHAWLRESVSNTLAHLDPQGTAAASQDMVLVGHSMGGVIARLMVSSADQTLWNWAVDQSGLDSERIERLRPRVDAALRFEPMDNVGRAIFIAAPHRGTPVAANRLARLASRMVRMPLTVLESLSEMAQGVPREQALERLSLLPNSIDNLREDDAFMRAAADLPISARVPYHSIIARRDPAVSLAASDDGLVPYRSAHLPGALSERVIDADHSVQGTAQSVLELLRILREDMAMHGKSFPPPEQRSLSTVEVVP